jgi:hypothetical protein
MRPEVRARRTYKGREMTPNYKRYGLTLVAMLALGAFVT